MTIAFSRRTRRFLPLLFAIGVALAAESAAWAADAVRQIPVARDRGGNEVTVEVSPDGARQTATPRARLTGPTADRAAERFEKRTGIDLRDDDPVAKLSREAGKPDGEITAHDAKSLLRALRDSLKTKQHATTAEDSAPATGTN